MNPVINGINVVIFTKKYNFKRDATISLGKQHKQNFFICVEGLI